MTLASLFTLLVLAEAGATGSVDASASTTSTPDATTSVSTNSAADSTTATKVADPWIRRHRPRVHDLNIGVFGGILAPARGLGVRGADATGEYAGVAPELGARLGYYPSRFFGLEGELSAAPTRFADARATLYAARAQVVLQAGFWRVVPFASLGGGVLGVVSAPSAAGRDAMPALSVGGGVKIHAGERVTVRVDVRDVVTEASVAGAKPTHSAQALLVVALRFGVAPKPPAPAPAPPDEDGDGIADVDDWCSHEAGDDPHGCPYRDSDCDTIKDNVDACPDSAGVAPDGCPPPDGDGDGIVDADDHCPELVGASPPSIPSTTSSPTFLRSTTACPTTRPRGTAPSGAASRCSAAPSRSSRISPERHAAGLRP